MNRRNFLKFLGATAIAPKVAVEVLSKIKPQVIRNPLFAGEFGVWNSVRIQTHGPIITGYTKVNFNSKDYGVIEVKSNR